MRFSRLSLIAIPALIAISNVAGAQDERLFQDSWFWGVHAGSTAIGTPSQSSGQATTLGADWFITRTIAGLYVSYDQSNFTRTSSVFDASESNGLRPVTVHNMRTVSIGGLAFPMQHGHFRPYAGLGFAISVIADAQPQTDPANTTAPSSDVFSRIDEAHSRSSVFAMGGLQWQIDRTAIFAQIVAMPSDSNFLVSNSMTSITAGIRYNFGSSIER